MTEGVGEEERLETADPRRPLQEACRYLRNNLARMDYPRYRQLGLPVTTALRESLAKEINYRVKGTEMFWNDPQGVEAILQIRAAALCDDDRLARFLATDPAAPTSAAPPSPPQPDSMEKLTCNLGSC